MRKTYLFAAAAVALASCANDEFLGEGTVQSPTSSSNVIGFGTQAPNLTRAGEFTGKTAAEKLNNNFIVYGFKTSAAEEADGSVDHKVFDLYNVNYVDGTANTTESNTADWEYVGYTPHTGSSATEQTIKYWDFSAKSYVFSAVSGTGITAEKIVDATGTSDESVYGKGWNITIPAGGSLSDLYASDRVPVLPTAYKNTVKLTFYNLGTKIRFGFYETIPGYSVQINKFYYNGDGSTTNFGVDGKFETLNKTADSHLTITYYDDNTTIENRPKVTIPSGGSTQTAYGEFGTNIQPTEKIGTASNAATYDQANGEYTDILPCQIADNTLNLKVDYTLTSTDGSEEQIHVYGATAVVPANFTQWKENFAYTYLFKISDNTNGSTDPIDPTNPDKKGLYPITFDAVVVGVQDGIQETITSVSDPSITTYQNGVVVTENNEYVAGDIFFENGTLNVENYKVYEVNNYGKEATTEEVVANYLNNFCVLTEVPTVDASTLSPAGIPLSDGTYISKTANQAYKFTAVAGKTYVITDGAGHYKVVKVAGVLADEPTYTQTIPTSSISAASDFAIYKLRSNSPKNNSLVLGAAPLLKIYDADGNDVTTNFTITPGTAGNYKIALTPAAIAAGANGDYTVKFNDVACSDNIAVGLSYTLTSSPVTVVTAGSTANFTLTDGTNAISNAVIKNLPDGVTITETETAGKYEVAASADATPGTYTTVTVAGQALTINVDTYAFYNVPEFTFDYTGTDVAKTLNLRKNYTDADVEVSAMSGINTSVATITKATAGAYTVVPVAPGSYTVKYENASAVITVNKYTLTPSATSIKKATGSTVLTLKKNNGTEKTVNASTAKVKVYKGSVAPENEVTSGFSLTTNGQTMKFGNVVAADTYIFRYTEDGKEVATATVTVTD